MKNIIFYLLLSSLLVSCIKDDIIQDRVAEQLRITMMPEIIAAGETFQFVARYTNNVGKVEEGQVEWSSSDESLLTINQEGLATAIKQGMVTISAMVTLDDQESLIELIPVTIGSSGATTIAEEVSSARLGTIRTTSSYKLEGDFTLEEKDGKLLLSVAENYEASSALPGLYIYLTNNPNTNNGAFEIGPVEIFKGAHTYEIDGVGLNDFDHVLYYCKPFSVKVGDGEIN